MACKGSEGPGWVSQETHGRPRVGPGTWIEIDIRARVSRRLPAAPQVIALVKQGNALSTVGYLALPVLVHPGEPSDVQKPCSGEVWWAREELNLRPLPCQIQRGSKGLYV
jgi:hypothetical protein